MILLDLNQVMISNIMMHLKMNKINNSAVNEDMIRHMVLNSIRFYNKKFGAKYGEMIICCDNKKYWRAQIFPYYKAMRKKSQETSNVDWSLLFGVINTLKNEIKEYLGYKTIEVETAEADDIIATLATYFVTQKNKEKVLILSSDKDFMQLQKYSGIAQYSPIVKKFIKTADPVIFLKEHIIRGDKSDGIPNVLSDDDTFTEGKRQTAIGKKKIARWSLGTSRDIHDEILNEERLLRGYKRNQTLIDLEMIPDEIKTEVLKQYNDQKEIRKKSKMDILNYFIKFNLKTLTNKIEDF